MRTLLAALALSIAAALPAAATPTPYPQERYVIDFPSAPSEKTTSETRCGVTANDVARDVKVGTTLYMVFVGDFSACGYADDSREALDDFAKGLGAGMGTILTQAPATVAGRPGLELILRVGKDDKPLGYCKARLVLYKGHAYAVMTAKLSSGKAVLDEPALTAFHQSFALTD